MIMDDRLNLTWFHIHRKGDKSLCPPYRRDQLRGDQKVHLSPCVRGLILAMGGFDWFLDAGGPPTGLYGECIMSMEV